MTNEEAAKILREIAQTNLPTVNGLPFPEIKKALILGADALAPIREEPRPCARCKHRTKKRTETGTAYGCEVWTCHFEAKDFPNVVASAPEPDDLEKSLDTEQDIIEHGRWRG